MSERKQVLEMLAEGKINAEEAERLLTKLENLENPATREAETEAEGTSDQTESKESGCCSELKGVGASNSKKLKYLRVLVNSEDGDSVNIQVPLALVRTGIKLSAMLPSDARKKLHEKGVDLSQFSELAGDDLIEALRDLNVDVDSVDGDKVRIFCE